MLIFYFLALFFSFLLLSNLLKKKKNLPPSPLTLPILGHLHLLKKPLPQTLQTLSAHYGPILFLRLGFRPVLLVSSPSAVEECFTKNDIIFANRPPLIAGKHLGYNHTTLEWAPYGHHWRHLRRIATVEIFSSNSLQTSSGIRSEEVRHMIRQLFQRSSDDRFQHLEFKSKFFELTFNIMMRMVAGKRYFDGEVANMEEARRSQEVLKETFFPSKLMNLSDFFPVLKWVGYQGPKWLIRMKRKKDSFLQALIDECRSIKTARDGSEKEKTLIGILLSLQEAEPEYYTDEIIKGIIAKQQLDGLAMRMVALAVGALVQCFDWEESVDMNEEGAGIILPSDKLATAMYRPRQTMTKVFSEI
ncbi:hypothetical protein HHK36_009835 [Tetracentron sinense]|uniref:Cytochrome P450 n=1 Tax=Tetracentron sinense TaxID=13715 RepID=A0A834ZFX3_TETSI|nr:hypothetical protein HHK36_009835 [Tetracentron sinense]